MKLSFLGTVWLLIFAALIGGFLYFALTPMDVDTQTQTVAVTLDRAGQ